MAKGSYAHTALVASVKATTKARVEILEAMGENPEPVPSIEHQVGQRELLNEGVTIGDEAEVSWTSQAQAECNTTP